MSLSCLERELHILEQIEANMDTQLRFIGKRKTQGLNRLTQELETLIQTLAKLEIELGKDRHWIENSELQGIIATIKGKKRAIIKRGAELAKGATLESQKIAGELRRVRQFKKAHRQYANIRFAMYNSSYDHKG
jgi:hypothetical protein